MTTSAAAETTTKHKNVLFYRLGIVVALSVWNVMRNMGRLLIRHSAWFDSSNGHDSVQVYDMNVNSTCRYALKNTTILRQNVTEESQHHDNNNLSSIGFSDAWLDCCARVLITRPLKPFPTRHAYRLGDCIKMCFRQDACNWHDKPENAQFDNVTFINVWKQKVCVEKNQTQHTQYNQLRSRKQRKMLHHVMETVVLHHNGVGFEKPPPTAIVIHLRLGDVIERTPDSVSQMLLEGGTPTGTYTNFHGDSYKNTIRSVYSYIENIRQANEGDENAPVVIVGGSHRKNEYKKSRVYLHCLAQALQRTFPNVTLRADSGDADKDFYYMAHSKRFVNGPGGYSGLIANYVRGTGGKVYGQQLKF